MRDFSRPCLTEGRVLGSSLGNAGPGIRNRADERTVPQGAQRRFPADDEQPYGTDGRDRRSGNAREQRFGAVDAAIGILP